MSKTYRDKARYWERKYYDTINTWDMETFSKALDDGTSMWNFIDNPQVRHYIYKNYYHYHWARSTPSWWNTVFHHRPSRRDTKVKCKKLVDGYYDADETSFRNHRKPHNYYW